MKFAKYKNWRNKKWLDVSDHSCSFCNQPAVASHPDGPSSHILGKSIGEKGTDIGILPLCQKHHDERDQRKDEKESIEALRKDNELLAKTLQFINHRLVNEGWILTKK
jgi:hypothetical protein